MANPIQHIPEKKSEVADSIVDAAERLLASFGYQKMTMTDLAAEAGIGVGTTYLHFASKADVALAVVQRMHNRTLVELENLAGSADSPEVILQRLLWHRVNSPYQMVRAKLATTSWQQLRRHGAEFMDEVWSSDATRLKQLIHSEALIIAAVISDGIVKGVFLNVDPMETASTYFDTIYGFMPKNLCPHDFSEPGYFELRVKRVIRLLINSILNERDTDGISIDKEKPTDH